MIGFLRGTVDYISEDTAVLDVGGVGYNVLMSSKDIATLPSKGKEIKIYTYLSVREDAMRLFGFLTREALDFFKLLICVNGVGPKVALGILAVMEISDLRFAIISQDSKTIAKCPGIGAKTAGRIILDLKDKIEDTIGLPQEASDTREAVENDEHTPQYEAAQALIALGFSSMEAHQAVRKVENSQNMGVEELIKAALKLIR